MTLGNQEPTGSIENGIHRSSIIGFLSSGHRLSRGLLILLLVTAIGIPVFSQAPPPPALGAWNEAAFLAAADWSVVLRTWRFKGICICGEEAGVITENAWPTGIAETVKQAGNSFLKTGASALVKLADTGSIGALGSLAGHSGKGAGETGTQFSEAHGFTFPEVTSGSGSLTRGVCISSNQAVIQPLYLSELDRTAWRTGEGDLLNPTAALSYYVGAYGGCLAAVVPGLATITGLYCAGLWGPIFPRRGFITQHSEVIASHLLAYRALHIAALPAGNIVSGIYSMTPPLQGHYWQLVAPTWRPAYQIGQGVGTTEAGATSPHGGYLYIHYPILECCSPCYGSRIMEPRTVVNGL